jgi:hypothetical protein
MKGLILFCIITIGLSNLYGQNAKHLIHCGDIGIPAKGLRFEIQEIKIHSSVNDQMGLIQSRGDSKPLDVVLPSQIEKISIQFLQKQYSFSRDLKIIMEITECRIGAFSPGKTHVSDTFLFQCSFYREKLDPEFYLFAFKARNLMGSFDNAPEVMNNFYSRVLLSATEKFSTSLKDHPEWFGSEIADQKPVKLSVAHNPIQSKDSIPCKTGYQLKPEDYQLNSKDTSNKSVFTKMTLTYLIDATENSKELNLKIYTKAFFHKSRSWYKGSPDWNALLPYHQGIYDLCMAYGIKLNKALKDRKFSLGEYRTEINTIYNEVLNEYAELRKKYQSETKEGMDSEQVSRWQIRIQEILKEVQN